MPIVSGFFRVFFAISILTLPGLSFLSAGPAADTLKAEAEPFEFVIPEPSSVRLENSPLVTPARAEWFRASSLYSDKTFKPAKQNRVDTVASKLIMLQGFHWYADDYWYHPAKGWWGVLADKAGEVGRAGFDLVWFPPVSNGSYYPNQWYNADSQWGKKEDLFRAVKNMHSSGVKVVADVVINHRNGTRDWADFTAPD